VLERAEMLVIATAGPYLIALQRPRVLVCAMDLAHCEALWTLKVSKLSLIIFALSPRESTVKIRQMTPKNRGKNLTHPSRGALRECVLHCKGGVNERGLV
jgi:hypothetical protein